MTNTNLNKLPVKWRRRIARAIKRGIDESTHEVWVEEATHWEYCAIGERREILKALGAEFGNNAPLRRFDDGRPNEFGKLIDTLGMEFYSAVSDKDWERARRVLDAVDTIIAGRRAEAAVREMHWYGTGSA